MKKSIWGFVIAALAVSLFIAGMISPFASSSPDGLDKFSIDQGFEDKSEGAEVWNKAPMADYKVLSVENEEFSTGLAGIAGTAMVFIFAFILGKLITNAREQSAGEKA